MPCDGPPRSERSRAVERLELLEPVLAFYVLNGAKRLIDLNDLNWVQPYVRAAIERLNNWSGLEPQIRRNIKYHARPRALPFKRRLLRHLSSRNQKVVPLRPAPVLTIDTFSRRR